MSPASTDFSTVDAQTVDAALRSHARRRPDFPALIADGPNYTYADLDAEIDRTCDLLADLGLQPGDRMALLAANSAQFVIALYAGLRARAVVTPLNPAAASAELHYVLSDCGATIVAADAGATLPAGNGAATGAVVALDSLVPDAAITDPFAAPRQHRAAPRPAPDDPSLILYTSGTTGRPKGALFDHARTAAAARAVAKAAALSQNDRVLIAAPLHHAAALGALLLPAALVGAAVEILPRFDPAGVIEAIERGRASVFFGVPTMYQLLMREIALHTADLSSVRMAIFGGAPMPVAAIEQLRRVLPRAKLVSFAGQTEAGPGGIYSTDEQVVARPDASGFQAVPGSVARVLDTDSGTIVTATLGGIGELQLRAPSVMREYWRQPTATSQAFDGAWLRTGDVVRVDADGSMTIVDRLKDMIITGGRNVYCAEVEQVIAELDSVASCAVVGQPHPLYGETVVAIVDPADGSAPTLAEVRRHCAQRLSAYKVPRRLLLRPLPHTATGKVDKAALRRTTVFDSEDQV